MAKRGKTLLLVAALAMFAAALYISGAGFISETRLMYEYRYYDAGGEYLHSRFVGNMDSFKLVSGGPGGKAPRGALMLVNKSMAAMGTIRVAGEGEVWEYLTVIEFRGAYHGFVTNGASLYR